MLNHIVIQGRLGSDPEIKTTPTGTEVVTINIAVDRDRKDQNGERQTDWIPVVAWKHNAAFLYKYFAKGRVAIIEGRLQTRNYTDKEGHKRTAFEVVADSIHFGDSKPANDGYSAPTQSFGGGAPQFDEIPDDGDRLPF